MDRSSLDGVSRPWAAVRPRSRSPVVRHPRGCSPRSRMAVAAVAMLASLQLAPPTAGSGSRDIRAEERVNAPTHGKGQESTEARRTRKIIEEARDEHLIDEWGGSIAETIGKMDDGDFLNKDDKKRYFVFLREVTAAHDKYAEELFWCWKGRGCHPGTMKSHCADFSSLVDQLTTMDKLASRDPLKAEVDDLLGEDEYQDYLYHQMPNVTFYLVYVCKDYRHQIPLLPDDRPRRGG
jgi:hypothetical protein